MSLWFSCCQLTLYIGRVMNSCYSVQGATINEAPNPVCVQYWERVGWLELSILDGLLSVSTPLSTTRNDNGSEIFTSENESWSRSLFQKMRVFMVSLIFYAPWDYVVFHINSFSRLGKYTLKDAQYRISLPRKDIRNWIPSKSVSLKLFC